MTEILRQLERAHAENPDDLRVLRALADERKRRGLELLPDVVRVRRIYAWEDHEIFRPRAVRMRSTWLSRGPIDRQMLDHWFDSQLPQGRWEMVGETVWVGVDGYARIDREYSEVMYVQALFVPD